MFMLRFPCSRPLAVIGDRTCGWIRWFCIGSANHRLTVQMTRRGQRATQDVIVAFTGLKRPPNKSK